ncbi:MAG: site-specific recombinase XerD [Solidesulfovibrio magneticus str. Maddingley MBC34]|uniref:Site-specific recombinase XerD n=1 Tax=Solidesulfovibrio magneticus str. Maddingley MBC34 TaxID=1206767 RepID=K6H9Z5_9BACT|nr:MAG: site-specific recombinase XerD [Solidesulfovibrio magneticus str. Maddingley MBC34]
MGYTWKQTKHEGVRYREHPTRKHGVKPDQYFAIRFRVAGTRREEALGWASQGWTAAKAAQTLAKLQEAARTGEGATSLAEKRKQAEAKRQAENEARAIEEREKTTLAQAWEKYLPVAQANKAAHTAYAEEAAYRLWLSPTLADKPLRDIKPIHLERIKKTMTEAGRSAQTIRHVLAALRQVFNFAKRHGLYAGDNPVSLVKKPSADARRLRFLTHEEADRLLAALAERESNVHDMALLALHCGLRAGEIFSLTWGDVDMERGVLILRDTKSGKTRAAYMTEAVAAMLAGMERRGHNDLVFQSANCGRIVQISETFNRVVAALGFNNGVTDPRQKVVFHTLRHTFASWLVEQGVDLYSVKELMGHGTLAMTERYSHLSPDKLRRAVKTLEAGMDKAKVRTRGKVVLLGEE